MRIIKFFESILISIIITGSRQDKKGMKEQIINKKKGLVEGWRSGIADKKLSEGLKIDVAVGPRLKIRDPKLKLMSKTKSEFAGRHHVLDNNHKLFNKINTFSLLKIVP